LLHGLCFQGGALFAALSLEQGNVGGDRHFLRSRTDLQLGIDRGGTDLQADGAAHQFLETILDERELVASVHDRGCIVEAVLIGGEVLRHARIDVRNRDRHAGDQRPRWVGNAAADVTGTGGLSEACQANENNQKRRNA
jgi:hypothetical protein